MLCDVAKIKVAVTHPAVFSAKILAFTYTFMIIVKGAVLFVTIFTRLGGARIQTWTATE